MDSVIKKLGIDLPGEYTKNNSYTVDIKDDAEWGKIYSILETNDDVEPLEDNTLLTIHNASLLYIYDEYQLNLKADFDNETYSLVCSKIGGKMNNGD